MFGPQIPYIKIPEIPLGSLPSPLNSIKPFGILVATGVYVGAMVALRRARQRHLSEDKMNSFILYVVGIGFIGAHIFDALFYTPERVAKDPIYLVQLWAGLSSYGGFLGAITGLLIFKYSKKESVLEYADVVCSAFPISWVFGRAGCSSVHDHPGRETAHWLGVQYYHPGVKDPNAWGFLYDATQTKGRFDLGLIEFALTIPLAVAFIILWRQKPRAPGFFAGWMSIAYAPVRFPLDFLRVEPGSAHEADPRYLGLTPAQWACFGLFALGVYLVRLSKSQPVAPSWEALHAKAAAAEAEAKREEEEATKALETERVRRKKRLAEDLAAADDLAVSKAKKKKKKAKPAEEVVETAAETSPEPSPEAPSDDAGSGASEAAAPASPTAKEAKPPEEQAAAEETAPEPAADEPAPDAKPRRKKKKPKPTSAPDEA